MKDNHAKIIMTKWKRIGDSSILLTECMVMEEAIIMAIWKNIQR